MTRRVPRTVWLLCLAAGLVSLALCLTVFRHGSVNNDEGVYLQQAELLRHGHLTLRPAAGQVDASQPWLFALRDGEYVGKYLPLVPALYAVGLLLFGSVVPVLVAMAAAVPLLTWRLAVRCGLSASRAAVAAGVVTLSPLVMAQGALPLSYVPFLLLLLVAWERALAWSAGAAGRAGLVVLGAASAAALSARPFDAVVLLGPVLVWALRRNARGLGWAALGALPPSAATLAYTWAVTGSPLRLPFGLLEPRDALGFGARGLFPEDRDHAFGAAESAVGFARHFLLGGATWTLLPAAVLALVLSRRLPPRPVLLASAALPVAYLAFWGPYSSTVHWHGTATIGPFYALPLLPVVALLVASAERRRLLTAAVAATVLLNAVTAANALANAREAGRRTTTLLALADASRARGVLLVDPDRPYVGHPVTAVRGDRVLVASVLDPATLPDVVREADLLQLPGDVYDSRFSYSLRDVVPYAAPEPVLVVRRIGAPVEVLVVERAGRRWACPVDAAGIRLRLAGDGVTGCDGVAPPPVLDPYRGCAVAECLSVTFHRSGNVTGWRRVVLARRGTDWLVPVDGAVVAQRGRGWVEVRAGE